MSARSVESTSTARTFSASQSTMGGEFEGEGREAALVFAEARAVDPDRGGGHYAFEVDEDALAARFGGQLEAAAIDRDELIGFLVEAVPGQRDVGVRNDHALERGIVELGAVAASENVLL